MDQELLDEFKRETHIEPEYFLRQIIMYSKGKMDEDCFGHSLLGSMFIPINSNGERNCIIEVKLCQNAHNVIKQPRIT